MISVYRDLRELNHLQKQLLAVRQARIEALEAGFNEVAQQLLEARRDLRDTLASIRFALDEGVDIEEETSLLFRRACDDVAKLEEHITG